MKQDEHRLSRTSPIHVLLPVVLSLVAFGCGGSDDTASDPDGGTQCQGGFHDGGDGKCVAVGTCSEGFHDGGEGDCVAAGTCSDLFHDDGLGGCVSVGACAEGFHDGGDGKCVATGACSEGFHDGGNGECVAMETCSVHFHDDGLGQGNCVPLHACAEGYHDGGKGPCIADGKCDPGYYLDGTGRCVTGGVCAEGYYYTGRDGASKACSDQPGNCATLAWFDRGDGNCAMEGRDECLEGYRHGIRTGEGHEEDCVPDGECSEGYHEGGDGECWALGTCADGFHDDGVGNCTDGGCAMGFHNGGDGRCAEEGHCTAGYHLGGDGVCMRLGSCSDGYHDGGGGHCVASGCYDGYHNGGNGVCVKSGSCSDGFHLGGGQADVCLETGRCLDDYHDGGDGVCIVRGTCAEGYHDGGDGRCLAKGACSANLEVDEAGDCTRTIVEFVDIPAQRISKVGVDTAANPKGSSVDVKAFQMGRTPVTVAQFQKCIDAGACRENTYRDHDESSEWRAACNHGSPKDKGDHPMNCVDHDGAYLFCDWVGARLPSEEEWVAAFDGRQEGAAESLRRPWGDDEPQHCVHGSYWDWAYCDGLEKTDDAYVGTAPVGTYSPAGDSPLGLVDLLGNVREWARKGNHWFFNTMGAGWKDRPALMTRWSMEMKVSSDYDYVGFRCARDR